MKGSPLGVGTDLGGSVRELHHRQANKTTDLLIRKQRYSGLFLWAIFPQAVFRAVPNLWYSGRTSRSRDSTQRRRPDVFVPFRARTLVPRSSDRNSLDRV